MLLKIKSAPDLMDLLVCKNEHAASNSSVPSIPTRWICVPSSHVGFSWLVSLSWYNMMWEKPSEDHNKTYFPELFWQNPRERKKRLPGKCSHPCLQKGIKRESSHFTVVDNDESVWECKLSSIPLTVIIPHVWILFLYHCELACFPCSSMCKI